MEKPDTDIRPSPDSARSTSDSARYAAYRILVADDQESITTLIERIVQARLGCQVLVAKNGDEVLARLATEKMDILVTDMMMPGLSGLGLVTKARSTWPDLDIIVMTGYSADFPYVEVMEAGADDFLNKPFSHAELMAKLIRIFRERELLKERMLAESKYRNLFERSSEGMVLLDDRRLAIVDANPAFCALFGETRDKLAGRSVPDLFPSAERARLEQGLAICARKGGGTIADLVLLYPNGKGAHVDVTASFISTASGEPPDRMAFLTFKDVTEKHELECQLFEAAQKDALTGLFNQRSFHNHLAWALKRARDKDASVTLLLIDLDNFKQCNDRYGHQIGDQVLASVGKVVSSSARMGISDEGFRIGGDEFAVILENADAAAGTAVARRMQSHFDETDRYETTMSIGVAVCKGDLPDEVFLRQADQALYKAKAMGRNAIQVA